MARAFRAGVEKERRIRAPVTQRAWKNLNDLKGLSERSANAEESMGELVKIPALIRIEGEHWVFERCDADVLKEITHKLVVHSTSEKQVIGGTIGIRSALDVAKRMADEKGEVVLIQPILSE